MAIKELQIQQKAVVAALSKKSGPNRSFQESKGVRCYFCKEMGHIARNCPFKLHGSSTKSTDQHNGCAQTRQVWPEAMKCTLCCGQGHSHRHCANNWTVNNNPSNFANPYEVRVPLNY